MSSSAPLIHIFQTSSFHHICWRKHIVWDEQPDSLWSNWVTTLTKERETVKSESIRSIRVKCRNNNFSFSYPGSSCILPLLLLTLSSGLTRLLFHQLPGWLRSCDHISGSQRGKKENEHQNFHLVPLQLIWFASPGPHTHTKKKASSACYFDTRIDQMLPEEKPSSQGCNKNMHLIDCDGACNLFTVMYPLQQEEHRSDEASQEEPLHYSTPLSVLLSYFGVGIT